MKTIYNKMIDWTEEDSKKFLNESRIKKMLRFIPNTTEFGSYNAKILDLGCFNGDFLNELKRRKCKNIEGADCNKKFVEATNKKEITAYLVNFEGLMPYIDEYFDAVFAGELIEHIYNTERFLCEIRRILKKDGLLILSTPNFNYWPYRIHHLLGHTLPIIGLESGEDTEFPGHIRYYTKESLTAILKKYGFEVDQIIGSNILNRGPWKLEKLADKWPGISNHLIVVAKRNWL